MTGDLEFLSSYLNISVGKLSNDSNTPVLTVKNGVKYSGLITIARYLASQSKQKDQLLGTTIESQAEISQWLEYRTTQVDRCAEKRDVELILEELNKHLANKAFFVDNTPTLADLLLYLGLYVVFSNLTFYEKQKYLNVSRWFDHVQNISRTKKAMKKKLAFQRNLLYSGNSH